MNETSLVSAIDALASKLGVAASEVYRVLIAQARVSAIKSGIVLVLMLALIAFAVWITRKVFKDWDKVKRASIEDSAVIFVVLADLLACVAVFFAGDAVSNMISALANPQFWALDYILSHLG